MITEPATLKEVVEMKKSGTRIEIEPAPCVAVVPCEHDGETRDGLCLSVRYRISCGGQVYIMMKTYSRGHKPGCEEASAMAVIIANARLKKDYDLLRRYEIPCQRIFFALTDIMPEAGSGILKGRRCVDVRDVVRMARLGEPVSGRVMIEYSPAGPRAASGLRSLVSSFTFHCGGAIYLMKKKLGKINEECSPGEMRGFAAEADSKLRGIIHTLADAGVSINRCGLSVEELSLNRNYAPVPESWNETLTVAGALN